MGIFKKSKAIYIDKMDLVNGVTVTEEKVHFSLNYSGIDMPIEDVPKLLADAMQLYSMVKPELDKKSEEAQKRLDEGESRPEDRDRDVKPIDLSEIPF